MLLELRPYLAATDFDLPNSVRKEYCGQRRDPRRAEVSHVNKYCTDIQLALAVPISVLSVSE